MVLRRANFTKIVLALCEYFEGPTSRKKLRPRTWAFRVSFFANIAGQQVTQNYLLTFEFPNTKIGILIGHKQSSLKNEFSSFYLCAECWQREIVIGITVGTSCV